MAVRTEAEGRTVSPTSVKESRVVDVRIGVTQSPRELSVELADDIDRDSLRSSIDAALSGQVSTLWLTDRRGRDVGVPAAKLAYVEIGQSDSDRRIGFGG